MQMMIQVKVPPVRARALWPRKTNRQQRAIVMAGRLDDILAALEGAGAHDRGSLGSALDAIARLNLLPKGHTLPAPDTLTSSDAVLDLIDDVLPGWSIHLTGKATERDGHWKCTLRSSASRDNDEFVGRGKGKVLSHALLAAMIRTADYLSQHRSGG